MSPKSVPDVSQMNVLLIAQVEHAVIHSSYLRVPQDIRSISNKYNAMQMNADIFCFKFAKQRIPTIDHLGWVVIEGRYFKFA